MQFIMELTPEILESFEEATVKTPANDGFLLTRIYENEFSQIGLNLLTRAVLCAALMAVIAGGFALIAGN